MTDPSRSPAHRSRLVARRGRGAAAWVERGLAVGLGALVVGAVLIPGSGQAEAGPSRAGQVASAALAMVLPPLCEGGSRRHSTRADAQAVRSAATMYLAEHPGGACPTSEQLTGEGYLDPSRRVVDAWGQAFAVECEGADVSVISAGPDRRMGTEDDLR